MTPPPQAYESVASRYHVLDGWSSSSRDPILQQPSRIRRIDIYENPRYRRLLASLACITILGSFIYIIIRLSI